MSLVALKNAVVSVVSKNDSSQQPLLASDSNNYDSANLESGLESSSQRSRLFDRPAINKEEEESSLFKFDPRVLGDAVIGLSDGLTVPFALTAGLSSLGDAKLVLTGGFAELISGAISMGLGGYLAAKSESDYYYSEVSKEKGKFFQNTQLVNHEVEDILLDINPEFSDETILSFIKDLQKRPEQMLDFIVRYGKGLDEPAENRQLISALTIGGSYFAGGFVPLIPYFFVTQVGTGLLYSVIIMTFTLFIFGITKTQLALGSDCSMKQKVQEGVNMVLVGGFAAGSAWYLVKLIG